MKIPRTRNVHLAALACGLAGVAVWQFYGNATRGYIDTASTFWWWGEQWFSAGAETEHGVLILALSGWLFWRNLGKDQGPRTKDQGPRTNDQGSEGDGLGGHDKAKPWALALGTWAFASPMAAMVGGLALHAVGFAGQQTRVSILALLLFAWGALRLAGGRRWSGAAAFPLFFLVFAIPLGGMDEIGLPLRLWVVEAGEWLARAAGIAVVRNGTQLLGPDGRFNYDVAAPCSGVNSLVALTALSLLIGYLNFHGWSRRALVMLPCLPLIYLGNVARITSIVFAAQWFGPKWGDVAHTVMGYGVFVIVLGGVFAAAEIVRRWWPEGPGKENAASQWERGDPRAAAITAAVVVCVAGVEMIGLRALQQLPPRGGVGVVLSADGKNPVELPAFLGTEWIGRRTEVTVVERDILPADTGFARKNYVAVADPSQQVFLSVVLSGRDRSSIHRPELCLVGQGWTIAGSLPHAFSFPSASDAAASAGRRSFPATVLRVRREVPTGRGVKVVPQLVAYWFVGGDTVVATHFQRLSLDAWNRVAHARADRWAYVLMQTDATAGEAAALARMQAVLNETLPVFQRPESSR